MISQARPQDMPPKTILLPNGTLLDMTGVVSVDIVAQVSPDEPAMVITCRNAAGEEQVERNSCETDEQAVEVRDVIRRAVRTYFPGVIITGGNVQADEAGERDDG